MKLKFLKLFLITIFSLLFTGCVAFISKKVNYSEERQVAEILSMHRCTVAPGSVRYYGEKFTHAKYIYGYAWKELELGYFIIYINENDTVEVYWSKDGSFPVLENRAFLLIPPIFI